MKRTISIALILFICQIPVHAGFDPILVGASGITRNGSYLLIAADKVPGSYFRYHLSPAEHGPRITFQPQHLECRKIEHAELSLDLEGINVLNDGRIVVLSEALYGLIGEKGIVVQYPESFTEFGGVGLEGITVRPSADGSSNVALIWEGGYPQSEKIPFQVRELVRTIAFNPVILLHKIPKNESIMRLKNGDLTTFELRVQRFEGKEPEVQRFRAPDLVWHVLQKKNSEEEWGFIVLLSSKNATEPSQYSNLWLQRFDLEGKRFGEPFDLKSVLPDDLKPMNWEGLSWYEAGKSLVITYDNLAEENPEAFIVNLPAGW